MLRETGNPTTATRAKTLAEAHRLGQASAFFPLDPRKPEDRSTAVEAAARPIDARVLEALRRQNARFAPSPAREAALGALEKGAAAVVTGQQVGLFLGPLFTVYKAASAIRIAQALEAESGRRVVPVFWLQTEDHDLPEIATAHVPGGDGEPLSLAVPAAPGRVSVAHLRLPAEVDVCVARLADALAGLPYAEEVLEGVAQSYRRGAPWAEAFARGIATLFAEEGLLLLDPRDPALAACAADLHRKALLDADGIAAALEARAEAIAAAGFPVAVHVRQGAPLAFFHPEGPEGPRYRLQREGAGYREVGGSGQYGEAELLAALEAEPLRFSTSALLRPLLQDHLLPTAAYVGGPGEIAYLAQLSPLYERFERRMPLIVGRSHFQVVNEETEACLRRHRLDLDTLRLPMDELLARCGGELDDEIEAIAERLLAPFERELDAIEGHLIETGGPSVRTPLRKTRSSVRRSVTRLQQRYRRARLRREGATWEELRRARSWLFPLGAPQERIYSFPYFAARYGVRSFLEAVLDAVEPFDSSLRILRP